MKLARYRYDNLCHIGRLENERIQKISEDDDMRKFITGSGRSGGNEGGSRPGGSALPLDAARLLPPIHNPVKVIGIGLNYMDHCREQHVEPPPHPILFAKFPTAIIGPDQEITWSEGLTVKVDYEAELGVVIGRRARNVSRDEALDFVFGYTCVNDVSARDLQYGDRQWIRGKSQDTFCPIGPVIVTADEIPDPNLLGISCRINGRIFQESNTAEMIFDVPDLVAFITEGITLEPGDVIASGTPHGVGVFHDPPRFLKAGDTVEIEIEKIGVLRNPVKGPVRPV